MSRPSINYLRTILKPDFQNGTLTFIHLQTGQATKDGFAGSVNVLGYRSLSIDNKIYFVHRILFYMYHGWFPTMIDHVDMNPKNNSISNLRPTTHSQNQRNRKNNKSVSSYNANGIVKTYQYLADVKVDGFLPSHVCTICKGLTSRKTHGGLFWKYN